MAFMRANRTQKRIIKEKKKKTCGTNVINRDDVENTKNFTANKVSLIRFTRFI